MGFDKKLADGVMDDIFRYEYRKRTARHGAGFVLILILTFSVAFYSLKNIHMNKTVDLRLTLTAPHATSVRVVGDFNQWEKPGVKMVADKSGRWIAEITVDPGTYRYLFLVDGDSMVDPRGITITDPFGEKVSVLNAEREVKEI